MRALISKEFTEQFKRLNSAQKEAVETIEGPVMVIAGPGTGKTTILTLRIANIMLRTDVPPEAILALTFTESGVKAMREKLVAIVGERGYRVRIHTFHSFANDIIRSYPTEFPRIIGGEHANELDQIRIVEESINNLPLKVLRPWGDPFYYVSPAINAIKDLKREDIGVSDYQKILKVAERRFADSSKFHEKGAHKGKMKLEYKRELRQLEKNRELFQIYEAYEAGLKRERLFDYEDMLMEVVRVLQTNEPLAFELQESAQYILADEHQDANNAQNKFLELMSSFHKESPNLFIVGDEKQAIFRFQGASLENFLYFKKHFPKAKIIQLTENYRSTQKLLDGTLAMIGNNQTEDFLKVKLQGAKRDGGIKLVSFATREAESFFVAKEIADLLKRKVRPEEVAVIYRDNRDVFLIERAIRTFGIPYAIYSESDLLAEEIVRKLLTVLEAVNGFSDEAVFKALMLDFFDISSLELFTALNQSQREKLPLLLWLRKNLHNQKIKTIIADLEGFAKLAHNQSLLDLVEAVAKRVGLVPRILKSSQAKNDLRAYDSFLAFIMRFQERDKSAKLSDLFEELKRIRQHEIALPFNSSGEPGAVSLLTAHRSKGLEFKYVFITGVYEGKWSGRKIRDKLDPLRNSLESSNSLEDDRRLFYVALTRAKETAIVSYPREDDNGKGTLPSALIGELDPTLVEKLEPPVFAEGLHSQALATRSSSKAGFSLTEKRYLNELFLERGLSVSALNNYLDCPWKYFFVSLLRLPQSEARHLIFGTAVHEGLKAYFQKFNQTGKALPGVALEVFESVVNKSYLSASEVPDALKKGREVLTNYLDKYAGTWTKGALIEFPVRGVNFKLSGATLKLNGKLDRIDFNADGTVTVSDFKTGSPKSRNAIEGKTKEGDAGLKRQLVFYKLLLDRFDQGRYRMKTGILDFVEPLESGTYKREVFDIGLDEVGELEKQIKKVGEEILTLDFWNRTCDEKDCEYCTLSQFLENRATSRAKLK